MSLICPFRPGVGVLSYENDEDARGKIIRVKPLNLTNLDMAKSHRVLFEPWPLFHAQDRKSITQHQIEAITWRSCAIAPTYGKQRRKAVRV